ncbi:hypothetical protein [Extensimonas sp. H3M7-6]|jgi:hypothetical protein|uniref:hypothetical protein n=1 Tax=Extensimonas soli TaxID=3031322 RepID=UPI0023DCB823|nr:hypothetical protein [Extensimonas sp. H3M7-6]MDF1483506.1 hypothetical protein [Extensimonas sp. H3M7-6]
MLRIRRDTEVATLKPMLEVRRPWAVRVEAEHRALDSVFVVAILKAVKRHQITVPAADKAKFPVED